VSLFFLGGGAQFVLFCSVDPFCFSSFVFSFCDFCPRGLSAQRAASFSGSSARVHVVWDSSIRRRYLTCRSFRLLWQYCQTAVQFGLRVDYESYPRGWATASPPRGRLLTSHAKRAAGSRPSSACVEPLRRPLAVTAEWADSSASESACLHRGGHPAERAWSVVGACTPDPVDLSSPRWSPPLYSGRPRQLSQNAEGSHMPRAEEKFHWIIYIYTI